MKYFVLLFTLLATALAARVNLLDISPEEAQKLISEQKLELSFAPKTLTQALGVEVAARSGVEGIPVHPYWKNGKIIENTDDYVEEIYEASQFHGQDGLGRFMFGYSAPDSARLEARNIDGEVKGSYSYIDPYARTIKVEYYADDEGFHHTDNIPVELPVPVEETQEVREARLAHEKAWKEAAALASQEPDEKSDYYNRRALESDARQAERDQELERYPKLPYDQHIKPDSSNPKEDTVVVDTLKGKSSEEEVTSEPRGFFYSFEYPVSVLVEKNPAKNSPEGQSHFPRARSSDGGGSVEVEVAPSVVGLKKSDGGSARLSLKADNVGAIPIDGVHDAQVPDRLRGTIENSQVKPVLLHD